MSAPTKLKGGTDSELGKLKKLWRDSMAESARDFWRELFISDTSQAEIRRQIFTKLKIKLDWDSQLNAFRDWEMDQRNRDLEAERMQEDERRVNEEHGDWSLEQRREEVLKRAYSRTLATGNFKLGLATVKQDVSVQSISLERDKFDLMKKKAEAFDQAKNVSDSKLTPEQKEAEYRRIFGMS